MNTAEVDLDRLVDYEREYRSVVKRAQVTGDHMIGLCPFHDDSKNSFSVDLKTGRWHCFSEDIGGNYVDFVAKINGISTKDAYKRIMEDYHVEMPEKEKHFIKGKKYRMKSRKIEKYGMKKGKTLNCKIIVYQTEKYIVLEKRMDLKEIWQATG